MSTPVRMCINCKKRYEQKKLYRLQYKDNKIVNFTGTQRSFYICCECLNNNNLTKNIIKHLKIKKEQQERVFASLKEIGFK